MFQYIPNPNWTIIYEKEKLILSAGADKILAIEDVLPETALEIIKHWRRKSINLTAFSPRAKNIFDQLITANIVKLANSKDRVEFKSISISFSGDKLPVFNNDFRKTLSGITFADEDNAELIIYIRTNCLLKNVVTDSYTNVNKPHLFVDLAYEHTFSLGPLVFPDETACIGCLIGRLSNYWGDPEPPRKPKIQENLGIILNVLSREVKKIIEGDQGLINKTISYDFENYRIKTDKIYKLPWCRFCHKRLPIENLGYIDLPWNKQL